MIENFKISQVQRHKPLIPVLAGVFWFEASLVYREFQIAKSYHIVRPCLKNENKKRKES